MASADIRDGLAGESGDREDFTGGVGRGRVDRDSFFDCNPEELELTVFTGLDDRKPAPTIAVISSSWVGNLIGDGAR